MANKIKKLSINAFEKAVKETANTQTNVEWNGLDIIIKHTIGIRDMLRFVEGVFQSCFSDDGEYIPEVRDFAIKSCLLKYYTNISLPSNVERRYDLIYSSDITEVVLEYVNEAQLSEIVKASDARIKHTANANIEALNKQMRDLYSTFENLQTNIEEIFSGINADDVKGLVSAVSNGGIDEGKIIDAYFNKKSDVEKEE